MGYLLASAANRNWFEITQAEVIHHYGCAAGVWQKILYIEYARQHLSIEGMADDLFLSILGM